MGTTLVWQQLSLKPAFDLGVLGFTTWCLRITWALENSCLSDGRPVECGACRRNLPEPNFCACVYIYVHTYLALYIYIYICTCILGICVYVHCDRAGGTIKVVCATPATCATARQQEPVEQVRHRASGTIVEVVRAHSCHTCHSRHS